MVELGTVTEQDDGDAGQGVCQLGHEIGALVGLEAHDTAHDGGVRRQAESPPGLGPGHVIGHVDGIRDDNGVTGELAVAGQLRARPFSGDDLHVHAPPEGGAQPGLAAVRGRSGQVCRHDDARGAGDHRGGQRVPAGERVGHHAVVHLGPDPADRPEHGGPGPDVPLRRHLRLRDHFDVEVHQRPTEDVGGPAEHDGLESAAVEMLEQRDQIALHATEGVALDVIRHPDGGTDLPCGPDHRDARTDRPARRSRTSV